MQINEIFRSISGESIQAGRPAIFIRTFGCPCRCAYCDSLYSVEGTDFKTMTVNEVLAECKKYSTKYVVLTGGEPLIQKDALTLIGRLVSEGYQVEIETSGAVSIAGVVGWKNITVTMDWKCPSSGMLDKMIKENLALLQSSDVLKCVVGSKEDLKEMHLVSKLTKAQVFVSPVFGEIEPKEIVEYVLEHNLDDVRVQLQLHKIVYPVDMRGV